jgi:hypothetical protein
VRGEPWFLALAFSKLVNISCAFRPPTCPKSMDKRFRYSWAKPDIASWPGDGWTAAAWRGDEVVSVAFLGDGQRGTMRIPGREERAGFRVVRRNELSFLAGTEAAIPE